MRSEVSAPKPRLRVSIRDIRLLKSQISSRYVVGFSLSIMTESEPVYGLTIYNCICRLDRAGRVHWRTPTIKKSFRRAALVTEELYRVVRNALTASESVQSLLRRQAGYRPEYLLEDLEDLDDEGQDDVAAD